MVWCLIDQTQVFVVIKPENQACLCQADQRIPRQQMLHGVSNGDEMLAGNLNPILHLFENFDFVIEGVPFYRYASGTFDQPD